MDSGLRRNDDVAGARQRSSFRTRGSGSGSGVHFQRSVVTRSITIAVALFFAVSAPAHSADVDDSFSAAAGAFVRGLVQEEDVGLFFGYLREALAAAADGRDAPVPDRLARRAEEIGERAKQRGVVAGRVLLDALEASVREMIGDAPLR